MVGSHSLCIHRIEARPSFGSQWDLSCGKGSYEIR